MNREHMIEQVTRAAWRCWYPGEEPSRGAIYGMRPMMEAVLDAILPQVTTVEDLDALYQSTDGQTMLIDTNGAAHRLATVAAETLESNGPLTIVWQPS